MVGGGISGLAAAWFYRQAAGPYARILILENHDDFGGHAKRNEFRVGNRLLLGYGGTQSIEAPSRYSTESNRSAGGAGDRYRKVLQILRPEVLRVARHDPRRVLRQGTFGADRLVADEGKPSWAEYLAKTPMSEKARQDMLRIQTERVDYMPGLSVEEKQAKLGAMSYEAFLRDYAKVDQQVITYFMQRPHDLWAMGIDGVPASNNLTAALREGLGLMNARGRGGGAGGGGRQTEPYIFHFPDGNASVARHAGALTDSQRRAGQHYGRHRHGEIQLLAPGRQIFTGPDSPEQHRGARPAA